MVGYFWPSQFPDEMAVPRTATQADNNAQQMIGLPSTGALTTVKANLATYARSALLELPRWPSNAGDPYVLVS
jgi:hypothetical protein